MRHFIGFPANEDLASKRTIKTISGKDLDFDESTISEKAHSNIKWELKMRTSEYDFWLCTQGIRRPKCDPDRAFVVGNVTRCRRGAEFHVGDISYSSDQLTSVHQYELFVLLIERLNEQWDQYRKTLKESDRQALYKTITECGLAEKAFDSRRRYILCDRFREDSGDENSTIKIPPTVELWAQMTLDAVIMSIDQEIRYLTMKEDMSKQAIERNRSNHKRIRNLCAKYTKKPRG